MMKTRLLRTAKILVSAGIVWAAWRWFLKIDNPEEVWKALSSLPPPVHVAAVLAASANWLLETRKWQDLVRHLEQLSFMQAWRSTMAGAAVSNIFPFRVGEYLGRIVYLQPDNRIPAAFNSVFGSMCQMFITLLAGIPSAWLMLREKAAPVLKTAGIATVALLLITVVLLIWIPKLRGRQGWIQRLAEDARKFTRGQILRALGYSALRYLVFGGFYVWLLTFTGLTDFSVAATGVATVFLLQSFAPSIIITDAGIRTALPLMVFALPAAQQPMLLAVAMINYIYNVLLPALVGLVYILIRKAKEI